MAGRQGMVQGHRTVGKDMAGADRILPWDMQVLAAHMLGAVLFGYSVQQAGEDE